jgi:hypothetical protein
MHVAVQDNLAIFSELFCEQLAKVDCGMKHLRWVLPPPIEVYAKGVAPVVPPNHAIWIEHWDYFKYELLP